MTLAERCAALPVVNRRLLAVVVVPMLLSLVCIGVVVPAQQAWQAQQRWRQETRQLLSSAAAAPALQTALEQRIEAVRSSHLHSKFYPMGGAMNAAAMLQADVDLLMSSLQLPSRTITPVASTETPSLLRHGVRLSASLRIDQLQELLNRIAQHPRLMQIEHLTVVAPQTQSAEENPPLAVTMDIFAYALAPEPAASAPTVMAAGGTSL